VRTSQDAIGKTTLATPATIFFAPAASKIGVLDTFHNRVLAFDSFDKWPDSKVSASPLANAVFGQADFLSSFPNGATSTTFVPAPAAGTMATPLAAAYANGEVYIADTGNSRVLVVPFSNTGTFGTASTRLLGQDTYSMSAPNLIEGREFDFFFSNTSGSTADAGIAVDFNGDTPHLYVSDPYNHRVLGFSDFRKVAAGAKADIVIGQPDMNSGLCNTTGNSNAPSATTLCRPVGLVVDGNGDLYVADSLNSRVLRFPAPFAHQGQVQTADLVLGQRNFTARVTDPTSSTMSQPYGVTVAANNGLLVSDTVHNRVLYFAFTGNQTFRAGVDNGLAATKVLGSPDFNTPQVGNTDTNFNSPHHIAVDNEARVYVADTGNNRIMIFDQLPLISNGAHASLALGSLSAPRGVFVSQLTSEIWVTDTNNNGLVKKYPNYGSLILNPSPTFQVQAASNALALAQDQFGTLLVADASNRVGAYFPALQAINGANFLKQYPLSPGLITSLCAPGSNCNGGAAMFGTATVTNSSLPNPYPMPTTLGDVQVLFKGTNAPGDPVAVPLYLVAPTQINFVVPMNAPTSGTADIQVVQASTGRIYAAGQAPMNVNSPAVFMLDYTGTIRKAAVVNLPDGVANDGSHPASRGSYVSIYATGQGFVAGAPADGVPPPPLPTVQTPRVAINGVFLDQYVPDSGDTPAQKDWVQFSGIYQFPGMWQINIWVPKGVVPGTQLSLLVVLGSTPSTDNTFRTVINVK
jgi:uncharacterized protein (TIGR03437 family)